jgi:hypothetical protein
MANYKPEQKWGLTEADEAPVRYAIDPTWMEPIEIKTPNKSSFLFKAGNRSYTLDGSSKNGVTSELSLRRKYA